MSKKKKKGSWVVRLRCVVIKEIVCEDCTEEEARTDPFSFADDESTEIEQPDYEVIAVEPNE